MDFSELRFQAREGLRGRWAQAIGVAVVAWILGGTLVGAGFLPQFSYHFRGDDFTLDELIQTFTTLSSQYGNTTITLNLLSLAQLILGGAVQLGYARILLKQHDKKDSAFDELFSQFHRFGQGFAQKFLRSLYSFLWGLLFIIPGFVKSYSYAMTPFIMADHPNLTASQAIRRSQELMNGYKLELFVLRLTFIGWDILAAMTFNLGHLVLNPYKNAAEAAFYRRIAGYPRITVE